MTFPVLRRQWGQWRWDDISWLVPEESSRQRRSQAFSPAIGGCKQSASTTGELVNDLLTLAGEVWISWPFSDLFAWYFYWCVVRSTVSSPACTQLNPSRHLALGQGIHRKTRQGVGGEGRERGVGKQKKKENFNMWISTQRSLGKLDFLGESMEPALRT